MTDPILTALAQGARVIDLGRPLFNGMPQSPQHPEYALVLQRRHGDLYRADGASGANEVIILGGHLGTHIDALSHAAADGRMYGGVPAEEASRGGRFVELGAETIAPILGRCLLLDVPRALGLGRCAPGYEVTVDDLERALSLTGAEPHPGDTILVRTGWGQLFDDRVAFEGRATGVPGPGVDAARWLAALGPVAVGGESISFEHIPAPGPSLTLPGHTVLLVEHGIYIIELLDLEELAATGVGEFTLILTPLKLVGGTGSPVRPLAVLGGAR